eukprot:TRINITY_DN212_c0_g1_i1.p1 TRINITY_DN212_c0_g1~~TRINITY_DN212_c0_g1_i1.p1  ORF type:complete len:584 (-),score=131.63 TRINITY_DN212_c0_g1_i1:65-1816(-)
MLTPQRRRLKRTGVEAVAVEEDECCATQAFEMPPPALPAPQQRSHAPPACEAVVTLIGSIMQGYKGTRRFAISKVADEPEVAFFSVKRNMFTELPKEERMKISRLHCQLLLVNPGLLGSTPNVKTTALPQLVLSDYSVNGTLLNGRPVSKKMRERLKDNDRITILPPQRPGEEPELAMLLTVKGGIAHEEMPDIGAATADGEITPKGGRRRRRRRPSAGGSSDDESDQEQEQEQELELHVPQTPAMSLPPVPYATPIPDGPQRRIAIPAMPKTMSPLPPAATPRQAATKKRKQSPMKESASPPAKKAKVKSPRKSTVSQAPEQFMNGLKVAFVGYPDDIRNDTKKRELLDYIQCHGAVHVTEKATPATVNLIVLSRLFFEDPGRYAAQIDLPRCLTDLRVTFVGRQKYLEQCRDRQRLLPVDIEEIFPRAPGEGTVVVDTELLLQGDAVVRDVKNLRTRGRVRSVFISCSVQDLVRRKAFLPPEAQVRVDRLDADAGLSRLCVLPSCTHAVTTDSGDGYPIEEAQLVAACVAHMRKKALHERWLVVVSARTAVQRLARAHQICCVDLAGLTRMLAELTANTPS